MANVSSLGVGSGLNLDSILSKLMTAERAPIDALTKKISTTEAKISLFGTLSSKLSQLQTAAGTLQFPSRLSAVKATSSDSATVSASAAYGAASGTYSVEVSQLASAQKSFTGEYAAGTTFSPGSLNFTVSGIVQPAINLNDPGKTGYTLEEVRDKINSANIGVSATVVTTSGGGQRMILTGNKTGADNAFSLTAGLTVASGGLIPPPIAPLNNDLSGANFDTTTPGLARSTAQNGLMLIEGIEVSSSTNTFTSIPGLTLTANKLSTGDSTSIKIESDTDKVVAAVKSLVDAYNAITTTIKSNSAYNSSTKTAQAFNGDTAARSVASAINTTRSTVPAELSSSAIKSLSDLGVTIQQSGQLTLDEAKLRAALGKSPTDAMTALQAYGKAFSETASSLINADGVIGKRVTSLSDSVKIYKDNQAKLEQRMVLIEKRYRTQFAAMDRLVSQMNASSSSLSQILSSK